MNRAEMLNRACAREKIWDFVVIGGGATGVGCAVDAASRGFSVLLLEQNDFGKGTSSRSTKLVHGGVRYLAQGNIALVREALKERGLLLKMRRISSERQICVSRLQSLERIFSTVRDLSLRLPFGKIWFGKSKILSKAETIANFPNIKRKNLRGGIAYFDGQFDDTRLLINLVQTAAEQGAVVLNYAPVFEITKDENGKICGVNFQDSLAGEMFEAKASAVINATGAFCDQIRQCPTEIRKN